MFKDMLEISDKTTLDLREIKSISPYQGGIRYYTTGRKPKSCFAKYSTEKLFDIIKEQGNDNFMLFNDRIINLDFIKEVKLEENKEDNKVNIVIFYKESFCDVFNYTDIKKANGVLNKLNAILEQYEKLKIAKRQGRKDIVFNSRLY